MGVALILLAAILLVVPIGGLVVGGNLLSCACLLARVLGSGENFGKNGF